MKKPKTKSSTKRKPTEAADRELADMKRSLAHYRTTCGGPSEAGEDEIMRHHLLRMQNHGISISIEYYRDIAKYALRLVYLIDDNLVTEKCLQERGADFKE